MAILPWILSLVLAVGLTAVLWYAFRRDSLREEELRRERDQYRTAFLEAARADAAVFGGKKEAVAEPASPPPRELTVEEWQETWSELDRKAYQSFCRGLAEDEHVTEPEDQLSWYLREHGRQAPFEVMRF